MKKVFLILALFAAIAVNGQGFTIDTAVTTINGITLPAGVQVLWWEFSRPSKPIDGVLVMDTTITFEVQFYANASALLSGGSQIVPSVNGKAVYNYTVTYTKTEFDNLSTAAMFMSLRAKLESDFGKGNVLIN